MTDPELPADLVELENRLASRPRVEPSAGLGLRMLDAIRAAQRETEGSRFETGY